MTPTELLRDYWYLMPVAVLLDALVLGGMAYGIWRGLRRYVTRREG